MDSPKDQEAGTGVFNANVLEIAQSEFLKYAPAYAQKEAREAIARVWELQAQGLIRNGLYYIVLIDLVGSTAHAVDYGNESLNSRIQLLVTSSLIAFRDLNIRNTGVFVKEIGDAVLYIFQHFPDVILWRARLARLLGIASSTTPFQLRTCIHVGEVYLQGANPLSLAVSQTFKFEKSVGDGAIALTATAFSVAWPTLAQARGAFREVQPVELPGYEQPVSVFELTTSDADDMEALVSAELPY